VGNSSTRIGVWRRAGDKGCVRGPLLSSEQHVSCGNTLYVGTPYYDAGVTTRYGSDALASDGYTLRTDTVYHDCHYTDDVFKEDNSQMFGSISGGGGSVTTNFYGTVNDQTSDLGTLTPGLGYNVTYSISTGNPAFPAYTFDYSHKCYPAYEAYVGAQRIYGYKPSFNDPVDISYCLAGGLVISGATIGTVN
jgi:FAD/FMN-containing dehydrogenase